MAKRIAKILIDDMDGCSLAAETVRFGIDGALYEVDLTAERASELRSFLNAYVGVARRV